MSILLIHPGLNRGTALIQRLTAQSDQVRVIESDPQLAGHWRALGAFVAQGSGDDVDLIERAAHSCRTLVLFDIDDSSASMVEAALEGARDTTIDRVVVIAAGPASRCVELLRSQNVDYIFARAARQSLLLRRRAPDDGEIAEVVDAADDLAGNPRLELDLSDPGAARALGLGAG